MVSINDDKMEDLYQMNNSNGNFDLTVISDSIKISFLLNNVIIVVFLQCKNITCSVGRKY